MSYKYREEKFAPPFFFPSRALLSIKMSNVIPTDMRSMRLSRAWLNDKSRRGIRSRSVSPFSASRFRMYRGFYCAPMRFSHSIGLGQNYSVYPRQLPRIPACLIRPIRAFLLRHNRINVAALPDKPRSIKPAKIYRRVKCKPRFLTSGMFHSLR